MKQLLFALLFIPSLLFAQEDQRYLAGAVPVVDGRVIFTRELNAPSFSQEQIYQKLLTWTQEKFNSEHSRVRYQNEAKGEIAIIGEEYLEFSRTALSLDRCRMIYNIIIECKEHACVLKMAGIRYEYNVSYQNEPEKYLAEQWITDRHALNKNKTKLSRGSGKFRKATIDFAEKTFDSAASALEEKKLTETASANQANTTPATNVIPATPLTPATPVAQTSTLMEGFVAFQADNVPNTILQMLPDNQVQIKPVSDPSASDTHVVWKGIGKMFGKTISTISISKESPVYKAIGTNDLYRLSFSKPGTSADDPWIIIECRKQGETAEGQQMTVIGEVTNVWIK